MKNASENIQNAVTGSQFTTRILVSIYLPSETINLVANDTQDLTLEYNGITYMAAAIKFGDSTCTLDGSKQQLQMTLANQDLSWSGYVANNGDQITGSRILVQEAFIDFPNDEPVWKFEGIISQFAMSVSTFQVTAERDSVDFDTMSPMMDYDPTCQYAFKDNHCRYSGIATGCDKTLTTCQSLDNVSRFGGHPSIPRTMVMTLSQASILEN